MGGTDSIDYDGERANDIFPGALQLVICRIYEAVTVDDGSLPLAWSTDEAEQQTRQVQDQEAKR